ncbi:MAG: YbhB/YbcL family Raf kinase inhibitor-like protein [Actinomycetaceae bacterium]|nr:YbhB/YbcL family Raf kinase inhibitor-like protein [Actinomycetaceae bacterium]
MTTLDPDLSARFDPYSVLPSVAVFDVESDDVAPGGRFDPAQTSGIFGLPNGQDRSPSLRWHGFPAGTRSFAVTVYDPDAPTASGFWHWAAANIPADVTELAAGAANEPDGLAAGVVQLRNDAGTRGFLGAAPPPGHGTHRYYIVVHAVDVLRLEVDEDTPIAILGMQLFEHSIGRASLMATFGLTE